MKISGHAVTGGKREKHPVARRVSVAYGGVGDVSNKDLKVSNILDNKKYGK